MILRTLSLVALLVASTSSWADGTTINWNLSSNESGGYSTNEISIDSGNVNLNVTAWSDSAPHNNDRNNPVDHDGEIESASLYWWGEDNGWGVMNNDELNASDSDHSTYGSDYSEHTIDKYLSDRTNHAFDNGSSYLRETSSGWVHHYSSQTSDLDMVLLTFDQEVVLEGFTVGWQQATWDNSLDSAGVTRLNELDVAKITSSSGQTPYSWGDVIGTNTTVRISEQLDSNATQQYYSLYNSPANDPSSPGTSDLDASRYWLVGLYQEMVVCEDFDSFKLLGVTARTATNVSEPASIAVFLIGLTMLYRRQQKQLKL